MKKFVIRDEDNNKYEVEEMEVEQKKDEELPKSATPTNDDAALSDEEIGALKKLASVADKLIGLVNKTDADMDKGCKTTDEDEDEDDTDTVIDTDEEEEDIKKMIRKDSKQSFGSIESKVKSKDSLEDRALEVDAAWAKRYGGNK